MSRPKCLFFKRNPPASEEEVAALAQTIPWAQNCINCDLRKEGKEAKLCYKDI